MPGSYQRLDAWRGSWDPWEQAAVLLVFGLDGGYIPAVLWVNRQAGMGWTSRYYQAITRGSILPADRKKQWPGQMKDEGQRQKIQDSSSQFFAPPVQA